MMNHLLIAIVGVFMPYQNTLDLDLCPFPMSRQIHISDKLFPFPTRKNEEPRVVATVYSARSFFCPACANLKHAIERSGIHVRYNYTEPSWIKGFPTVVYRDGSSSDNGEQLYSLIKKETK